MCIICNLSGKEEYAEDFMSHFFGAQDSMNKACQAMLDCSIHAVDEQSRIRYNAIHKKMVRITRDWNRIEQEREDPDFQEVV